MKTYTLPWPLDAGRGVPDQLYLPGSNLVYDLHGDPCGAELRIVMEGNQFMVIPELLERFSARLGRRVEVFYVTLPPGRFLPLIEGRPLAVGNLILSLDPQVVMGPPEFMQRLLQKGLIQEPRTFTRNRGVVLVVPRGNPLGIRGPEDLLRPEIRVAISNPETETQSYRTYLQALSAVPGLRERIEREAITGRLVHHREIPALIYHGEADVAPLYYHFARYYQDPRFFPEPLFDYVEFPAGQRVRNEYQVALRAGVEEDLPRRFRDFLLSEEARRIYASYGFEA